MADLSQLSDDERRLAELGYKQELTRSWSSFSNFAISFSIISILAGCFTTFYQGWNNGGPVSISLGWPLVAIFILFIGLSMSELVSAYPTSGGIYWWASKLGGVKAGYYTGWLNLIGLVAILASVVYGAASFLNVLLGSIFTNYSTSFMGGKLLKQQFVLFLVILALVTLVNIFSSHLLAVINNVSVWWHVFGAAIVILILIFAPSSHMSVSDALTMRVNNSGFGGTGGMQFWLVALPFGFLLTQYTITGYDASAHLSEETQGAANGAAKGIWQSIFYSAIGGWILLLTFVFAAHPDIVNSADPKVNPYGVGSIFAVLSGALTPALFKLVVFISMSGQLYCSVACCTSASRMTFAFSRDGAVPGASLWSRVNAQGTPRNAVLGVAAAALVLTIPALKEGNPGQPVAFLAIVSIGVIGLYLAFAIPIWYRWKLGDAFKPGPWTLGGKYKWMNILAVAEIVITSIYFVLPFTPSGAPKWIQGLMGVPAKDRVDLALANVNYTPIVLVGAMLLLWIGWHLSAKNWFTGPKTTVDLPPGVSSADEIALEHQHKGYLTGEHDA